MRPQVSLDDRAVNVSIAELGSCAQRSRSAAVVMDKVAKSAEPFLPILAVTEISGEQLVSLLASLSTGHSRTDTAALNELLARTISVEYLSDDGCRLCGIASQCTVLVRG